MKKRIRQMKKEITVDKALLKYHQIDNALILTASIAFFITLFLAITYFQTKATGIISFLAVSAFILLFAVLGAILSPTFNIWKLWAFGHVRNVHELKQRLILLGEISEENIFFKKIENSTENDKKYWKIHLKFAQKNISVDDETIPKETFFYYSKTISIMITVLMIPIFAYGILLLLFAFDEKDPMCALFGIFFLIMAIILGYYFGYKKLINREPQLTLNNKGINTKKTGFHKWEEIERCFIISGHRALLKYTHSRGHENIDIQELNVKNNGIKLSKLLMVYRERNKLQNSGK
jgi:FlaA1/EpsC-like NDP-sugar epimerase